MEDQGDATLGQQSLLFTSCQVAHDHFINYAREFVRDIPALEAVTKALDTLERHKDRVLRRWRSTYTNARLEGLNSLFQAARSRARGYRNTANFITMIYLIAAPLANIMKST